MKKLGTLIFGALIGAVAALLLSPKRGTEWRDELKDKGEKMRDQVSHIGAKMPDVGNAVGNAATAELFNSVKEKGAEFIGEAGEHLRDMKESAAQKIGEVKQEASGRARVVSAEVSDVADRDIPKS